MTDRASYFDTAYRDYQRQNPPHKLDHYLAQVTAAADGSGGRLLDIGCGLGSFLQHLSSTVPEWELFATDVDPIAIATLKRLVPQAAGSVASAELRPYPTGHFDVITAWDVLEHVADLDAARHAIWEMLKPGGRFLFVVPVYDGPLGPVVRVLDTDPTHIHRRSRSHWLDWARSGFHVVEWHGITRRLLGPYYLHVPTRRWRRWSPAILVNCSKPGPST